MLADTLTVNGHEVEVRSAGSGPELLYLHSLIGDFWVPPFLDALTPSRTVVCPALPGFGRSQGIESIDDMEDLAFHVDAVIDALSLTQVDVVASCFGGWVACEVAVRWPSKFRSLNLIGPLGLREPDLPIAHLWGVPPEEMVSLLFSDPVNHFAMMLSSLDLDNPPQEEILIDFLSAQAAVAKIGWDPYLHDPKLAGRLHRISCPTQIVWGRHDRLLPAAYADRLAARIPGATAVVVEGGHLVGLESPSEVGSLIARAVTS